VHSLAGDRGALRLCRERISPARRGTCIRLNLPSIRSAQDLNQAAERVAQAIKKGKVTPGEGETLMNILEIRSHG
jgi:hypothetical protein